MLSRSNQADLSAKAGFTMVEMLVVIAIFGIVTTILLFNLPTFRNQASLDLVAQEVAITIRGAQVFGGGGPPTYGIYIDQTNSQFDLFRDLDGSGGYNNQPGIACVGECVERYALSGGFKINDIACDATTDCNPLEITFTRPNLEPIFRHAGTIIPYGKIIITIKSLRDQKTKSVLVWSNGQIATSVVESN